MPLRPKHPMVLGEVRAELVGPSTLRLEGILADDQVRREVARLLAEVHEQVVAARMAVLTVDVRRLSYANSSAIGLFIEMASRAERSGYRLVLEIDGSIRWHRLNFEVLQAMAPGTIEVRESSPVAGSR